MRRIGVAKLIEQYTGREADELKRDESAIRAVLVEAGTELKRRDCVCPFCDDKKKPSAGIYSKGDGVWRYKCHKCGLAGTVIDLLARVEGIEVGEVFRQLGGKRRQGGAKANKPKAYADLAKLKAAMPYRVERVYQYVSPQTGRADLVVLRMIKPDGSKEFRQARQEPSGGYVQRAPSKPWPLYNRYLVQRADTVVVAEGEKCVDCLTMYGIAATTSPAGAGKSEYADWSLLAGKRVILWPDNDDLGKSHMSKVERIIEGLRPQASIAAIEPSSLDLGPKEDVADYVAQLETLGGSNGDITTKLREVLAGAVSRGIAAGVEQIIEDTIAGRREAIRWPWSSVSHLTKALQPTTVTLLCGNVGASKSFQMLESAAYWHDAGVKLALFELEETRSYHLMRVLAQRSECSDMTDPDWIKANPLEARAIFSEYADWLNAFGQCVYASPMAQPSFEDLVLWAKERAQEGCRIIAIDPITVAAHKSRAPWDEDAAFLHEMKQVAMDFKCSVLLVTHPIKNVSSPDVTQLSGGAGYSRFAQTIMWLESHAAKPSEVRMDCGRVEVEHNRTLHLLKVRNGKGQGMCVAFTFSGKSLCLHEEGAIVKRKKGKKGD